VACLEAFEPNPRFVTYYWIMHRLRHSIRHAVFRCVALAITLTLLTANALGASTVKIVTLAELSGEAAASGIRFKDGVDLAVEEINAAGGILGSTIENPTYDTQGSPALTKALVARAVDEGAFAIIGPLLSGTVMVSMEESQRAHVPQFVGAEATAITHRANPYVFRTSLSQEMAMPQVARYLREDVKARRVLIVYASNVAGKGARDELVKALASLGIAVAGELIVESGQINFSDTVLRARKSDADSMFVYANVEESARLLHEIRKQDYDKPVIGETTLLQHSVIAMAGEAAEGIRGHVTLTIDAPNSLVRAFAHRFHGRFGFESTHDGIKGYIAPYIIKAVIDKIGEFNRENFAAALRNVCLSARDYPGILLDLCYDGKGDIARESYIVTIRNGKQVVERTLPRMSR
jgi:branched-chain amino acid transport system substrate-binding protein